MKLPIKHEYFQQIKNGTKKYEFRDSHITFVDEDTKEELRKDIDLVSLASRDYVIKRFKYPEHLFTDDILIRFSLK